MRQDGNLSPCSECTTSGFQSARQVQQCLTSFLSHAGPELIRPKRRDDEPDLFGSTEGIRTSTEAEASAIPLVTQGIPSDMSTPVVYNGVLLSPSVGSPPTSTLFSSLELATRRRLTWRDSRSRRFLRGRAPGFQGRKLGPKRRRRRCLELQARQGQAAALGDPTSDFWLKKGLGIFQSGQIRHRDTHGDAKRCRAMPWRCPARTSQDSGDPRLHRAHPQQRS